MAGPGTTLVVPEKRVEHIELLRPEICTLDLNTMNSGGQVVINTPTNVRKMANRIRAVGVMPELELFDSGDCHLARDLIAEGVLQGPGLFSLVLGVKYGFNASSETMLYGRNLLPPGAIWTASASAAPNFRWSRRPICMAAMSGSAWRTISLCPRACSPRTNAELVTHAANIVKSLGGVIASASETRAHLGFS